jgi:hypothetical protein
MSDAVRRIPTLERDGLQIGINPIDDDRPKMIW